MVGTMVKNVDRKRVTKSHGAKERRHEAEFEALKRPNHHSRCWMAKPSLTLIVHIMFFICAMVPH